MKIITLTQREHDAAVAFMNKAIIGKQYSDYLHIIGEDTDRRALLFRRLNKEDWQLVTPIMIVSDSYQQSTGSGTKPDNERWY